MPEGPPPIMAMRRIGDEGPGLMAILGIRQCVMRQGC